MPTSKPYHYLKLTDQMEIFWLFVLNVIKHLYWDWGDCEDTVLSL